MSKQNDINEFRRRYAAAQRAVSASDDLKARAGAYALREAERQARAAQADFAAASASAASEVPVARVHQPARWAIPVAACAAACALAFGAPVIANVASNNLPLPTATSDSESALGFSVRAYAADGTPMAAGENGMVLFDRKAPLMGGMPGGGDDGSFTGCLLRVEGDGIVRLQMNISHGELYRYETQLIDPAAEPERAQELLGWKPTSRGTGTYYAAFDATEILPIPATNGSVKGEGVSWLVGAAKLYGSTVDVSAADDPALFADGVSFGLWSDSAQFSEPSEDPYAAVIDQFNGQHLTVTATFADGSTSTQVIELHATDTLIDDTETYSLTPEALASLQGHSLRTLYGTVVESNDGTFPLPLDAANEHANEVLPPETLSRQPETLALYDSPDENAAPLTAAALLANSESTDGSVAATAIAYSGDMQKVLRASNAEFSVSALPPEGYTLKDFPAVQSFLGNIDYLKKCSREVFGYSFNDDGTLTEPGYSFVTASYDITNEHDVEVEAVVGRTGDFAIANDEGCVEVVHTGYMVRCEVTGHNDSDAAGHVFLAPGETVRVTCTLVLPDHFLTDDTLMYVFDGEELTAMKVGALA